MADSSRAPGGQGQSPSEVEASVPTLGPDQHVVRSRNWEPNAIDHWRRISWKKSLWIMIKHQHCYFLQGAIRKGGEGVGNVGFEKKRSSCSWHVRFPNWEQHIWSKEILMTVLFSPWKTRHLKNVTGKKQSVVKHGRHQISALMKEKPFSCSQSAPATIDVKIT